MTEHPKLDPQHDAVPEDREDRLERQGLLRRARAPKSPNLFNRPRLRAQGGASILETLLEERRSGR